MNTKKKKSIGTLISLTATSFNRESILKFWVSVQLHSIKVVDCRVDLRIRVKTSYSKFSTRGTPRTGEWKKKTLEKVFLQKVSAASFCSLQIQQTKECGFGWISHQSLLNHHTTFPP